MLKRNVTAWVVLAGLFILVSFSGPKTIDDPKLRSADQDSGDWLMYGRTHDDHRFSPLKQINEQTVGKTGAGLEPRTGHHARVGSNAAGGERRHLYHRLLERRLRH